MHRRYSPRDRCARTACLIATLAIALGGSVAASSEVCATPLRSYQIGNSLTWDSRPDWGLGKLATDAGHTLTTGYHIRCNSSLDYIAGHPSDTCVTPNSFGYYTDALLNNTWDAVTLQPFGSASTPSTPRMEYEGAKSLIQLARQNPDNLDTTFYLYTGWMSRTDASTDFYSAWHDPAPIDPDLDLIRNAATFAWVYDTLTEDPDLAEVELRVIPVGDVLAELDRRMTLGVFPGFAGVEDLYRDDLHMNNLGWFVASNTVLSTLFGIDPTGTPTNNAFVLAPGQTEPIEITPQLGAMIQDAVWDVVRFHPHAGFLPGDLTGDGFVGIEDLNIVLSVWNQNVTPGSLLGGDPSGDGYVGIEDLNEVLGNWNAGTVPGVAVPEPACGWLLLLVVWHRRRLSRIRLTTTRAGSWRSHHRYVRTLCCGGFVLMGVATHASADTIDLYIISGQSNGFESRVEPADNVAPELTQVHPGIRYAYNDMFYNTATPWFTLRPRTLYSPSPGIGIGVEMSFGTTVDTASDNPVAIIKAWRGGADLDEDFNPQATGGLMAYAEMMAYINQRVGQLEAQGHTVNLKGFAWIQGESDAAEEPEQADRYGANLANLIATLRTDFAEPDLPFVYNRLNIGTDYIHEAGVRAGQEWVSQNVPGVAMLDVDDVPLGPDTHHYGVNSKVELGYRFAEAIQRLINPLSGDLDIDGFVGIGDLNTVLSAWNLSVPPANLQADPSGDGFVGIADLNIVLSNWNVGIPPADSANIPEPGGLGIMGSLGVMVMRSRRIIQTA